MSLLFINWNRFNIYIFFQPPIPPFSFFNVHNIEEYVFCEQNPGNPPNSVQKSIDPSLLEANLLNLSLVSFVDKGSCMLWLPGVWYLFGVSFILIFSSATQNMDKYIHIEILKVFTNFSYCFILYAFAITSNTLLTSSCTVHSRKFPTSHRYMPTNTYLCYFVGYCIS